MDKHDFEPEIVGFFCNWCSYEGADAAGRAKKNCPWNLKSVRVMCSGQVDPLHILKAFKNGADGVLVLGCLPGECHYKEGNFHALKRMIFFKKILEKFGIEKERVRLDWICADDAQKFSDIAWEMVGVIKNLGPLNGKIRFSEKTGS